MNEEYKAFLLMTGALMKLVVISMIVERGLAWVFEHDWFIRVTTRRTTESADPTKTTLHSRIPGLKGLIALIVSIAICLRYKFDIMSVLFTLSADEIGEIITGFVVAGGSAGSIAIFQGFLGLSKETRDSRVEARKAEADATRQIAESAAAEAKAKNERAEAEKIEAETRRKIAQSAARLQGNPTGAKI